MEKQKWLYIYVDKFLQIGFDGDNFWFRKRKNIKEDYGQWEQENNITTLVKKINHDDH